MGRRPEQAPTTGILPSLTSRQVLRVLARAGWRVERQEGGLAILERDAGVGTVVVPVHPGDLRPGTLRGILKQAGLTPDEFNRLRLGKDR